MEARGTIPFSQISWTSSGAGDAGAQPFPSGTYVAGSLQTSEPSHGINGLKAA